MTPTSPKLLLLLAVPAIAIGWAIVQLYVTIADQPFPVPFTAAATMFVLAAALFIWTLLIRPRIARKPGTQPLSPFTAARTAALAMAASRTGALAGGFYIGVAIELAGRFDNAYSRERLFYALGAAFGAFLVVLAALWLEHICRLPGDDDDKPKRTDQTDEGSDWVLPSHRKANAPSSRDGDPAPR